MRRDELAWRVPAFLRGLPVRMQPWLRFLVAKRAYRLLTEEELRTTRRSDTVFVFGSGASLNEITPIEWRRFEEHDTLGFNWFVHQRFVRCDYHLIRGIPDDDLDRSVWRSQLAEYFDLLRSNPYFTDTVFLVQSGFRAINGNRAIGYRYLSTTNDVFLWRTNTARDLPSESFAAGLVHRHSTLEECVNLAYLTGWRRIVLVGVDLYDRRYFWLPPDEARSVDERRGASATATHDRATSGMVEAMKAWGDWLGRRGVELSVYNPRSLLAARLPVYSDVSHVS
jgi:hypothetical protein